MLLFKKQYLDAIRAGRKSQTIRLWPHRRMRPGQRSYIPGAGYVNIEQVEAVQLEELSEEDAARDGFDSADALRAEIRRLYEDAFHKDWQAYRVCFRLLEPAEQTAAREERRRRTAANVES